MDNTWDTPIEYNKKETLLSSTLSLRDSPRWSKLPEDKEIRNTSPHKDPKGSLYLGSNPWGVIH